MPILLPRLLKKLFSCVPNRVTPPMTAMAMNATSSAY